MALEHMADSQSAQQVESERLVQILDTMSVPRLRRTDWHWLGRNLAINNGDHPDITEALRLVLNHRRVASSHPCGS